MKISKIYLTIVLILFFGEGLSYGYLQEGFSQYQEGADGISFKCQDECIIKLGERDGLDYLNITGTVNGNGVIGYGFYTGNQFYFLSKHKFITSSHINKFVDLKAYKKELDLVLCISGHVSGNLDLQTGKLSFGEKIRLIRNGFLRMETFKQYSINFRYGIFFRGISIVKCGYIIFILFSLFTLAFIKDKSKFKLIFYMGIWLFLFIGIRNLITYTIITNEGLNEFKTDKNFFELKDYYLFVDKIRKKLDLDSSISPKNKCKILMEHETDFDYGPVEIYLKPCELALTGEDVDYKVYYKKEIPVEDLDKKVLIDFSGSYLLENKPK